MKTKKAQGALEYLLIIGAAVIIAVIVIAVIMGLTQQGTKATSDAKVDESLDGLKCQRDCNYLGPALASNNWDKTCYKFAQDGICDTKDKVCKAAGMDYNSTLDICKTG